VKAEDWKIAIKPKLEEAFEDSDMFALCEDENDSIFGHKLSKDIA
jgi:hypothetical protein